MMTLICLLFSALACAQPVSTPDGVLKTESGDIYGPQSLLWTGGTTQNKSVYVGNAGEKRRVLILDLSKPSDLKGPGALNLFKSEIGEELRLDLTQMELVESLSAPYPWPDSAELRVKLPPDREAATAYIGSGSGRTLIICVFGEDSSRLASSMAFSFKEKFQLKRDWQAKTTHSDAVVGPLATGATFLFLFSILAPAGITLIFNRRQFSKRDPFLHGLIGLGIGVVTVVPFGFIILSRFAATQTSDYFDVFGGIVGRAVFLALVTGYASKKWREKYGQSAK